MDSSPLQAVSARTAAPVKNTCRIKYSFARVLPETPWFGEALNASHQMRKPARQLTAAGFQRQAFSRANPRRKVSGGKADDE
jgi:hypothetical protein